MRLDNLIERGYFPKELPPPFNAKLLANQIANVMSTWESVFTLNTEIANPNFVLAIGPGETSKNFKTRKKNHANAFISKYNSSKATIFSISKGRLSRRFLQIPNPKHFAILSEKIVNNWNEFQNVFALSEYSKSYPIPESSPKKRSVSTFSKSVSEFRDEILNASLDKMIEVKVDISKFYPSIYTHSITWGLMGKEKAKEYFKQKDNLSALIAAGDLDAALYKASDEIDIALRSCQERQSVGIPIGPDTSHIIAEVVGCRIDTILKAEFNHLNFKACRYYDDYYLYVSTKDEADRILKGLQLILSEFQLEINESKVKIREFPFSFEDTFVTSLFLFEFKGTNQNNSLKHYFSLIWDFAEKNPKKTDWIFKYSLRVFEFKTVVINKKSWKLFEDLIFKTALIEPSVLDIVTRLLLTYNSYIDVDSKIKLKRLLNIIICDHSPLRHNFEVSWALWIAKTFNIEITELAANNIIKGKDSISNIILIDIIKNTALVEGVPSLLELQAELKEDILFTENWLLAYEGVKKGWLIPSEADLIENNLYFKILKNLDIEFYDSTKQLIPYGTKQESIQNINSEVIQNLKDENVEEILLEIPDFNLGGFDGISGFDF